MQFRVDQRFAATPDDVLAMYCTAEFYDALDELTRIGRPEVLSVDGGPSDRTVRLRIRYAFTGHLPGAALAVIDPKKLTWVEDTSFDTATRTGTTKLLPDHYPDRLTASARSTIKGAEPADDAGEPRTVRRVEGTVSVRMPFVGGQVEKAIVSGLRDHLADEQLVATRWLRGER